MQRWSLSPQRVDNYLQYKFDIVTIVYSAGVSNVIEYILSIAKADWQDNTHTIFIHVNWYAIYNFIQVGRKNVGLKSPWNNNE